MRSKVLIAVIAIALLAYFSLQSINPASVAQSQQHKNDTLIESSLAYHVGVLGYLYGYPLVDMAQRMHNETQNTGHEEQRWSALVNRLHRQTDINADTLQRRGPDPEMLYFSGWLDLSDGPVLLNIPDIDKRFFSIAVTDAFADIKHFSSRDINPGTDKHMLSISNAEWHGELPAIPVSTLRINSNKAWLSGQLRMKNRNDAETALSLLNGFWLAGISEYNGQRPAQISASSGSFVNNLDDLSFFATLQQVLRENTLPQSQTILLQQFNRVGFGPDASDFSIESLPENHRTGLDAAIKEARKMILASTQRSLPNVNGWMPSSISGDYSDGDFMRRATAVKSGSTFQPSEMMAMARVFDEEGLLLSGKHQYTLAFAANSLPPVDAHWSISIYNSQDFSFVENPANRHSLSSNDTLKLTEDGGLKLLLQQETPADTTNWLPTPSAEFVVMIRLYHPQEPLLNGEYQLPTLMKIKP